LSALPFGQFSTARSNGTNKVIDTQGTFLVFLPVFAKLQPRFVPSAASRAATPTTGQTVCKLVTLRTPTDACIPFLFNRWSALRLRRRPMERYVSPLFPCSCRRFSSQQGGTPPSPRRKSSLFRAKLKNGIQFSALYPHFKIQPAPSLSGRFDLAGSSFSTGHESRVTGPRATDFHARVTYSFRINTCKSVSKQTTLNPFRMNTYEKTGGRGPTIQNFIPEAKAVLGCPTKVALRHSSLSVRGGRS
jgi:hypothetical protein